MGKQLDKLLKNHPDVKKKLGQVSSMNTNLGMVPAGIDPGLFSVGIVDNNLDPGAVVRYNALKSEQPRLNSAIATGDIFAYNAAFSNLRKMISRTTGGPVVPDEMPDSEEIRRQARLRRRKIGSREQTLNLGLV